MIQAQHIVGWPLHLLPDSLQMLEDFKGTEQRHLGPPKTAVFEGTRPTPEPGCRELDFSTLLHVPRDFKRTFHLTINQRKAEACPKGEQS